jgi:hypothetical protein
VALIIRKHLEFSRNLCCFKKRRFVNTRKGKLYLLKLHRAIFRLFD